MVFLLPRKTFPRGSEIDLIRNIENFELLPFELSRLDSTN